MFAFSGQRVSRAGLWCWDATVECRHGQHLHRYRNAQKVVSFTQTIKQYWWAILNVNCVVNVVAVIREWSVSNEVYLFLKGLEFIFFLIYILHYLVSRWRRQCGLSFTDPHSELCPLAWLCGSPVPILRTSKSLLSLVCPFKLRAVYLISNANSTNIVDWCLPNVHQMF